MLFLVEMCIFKNLFSLTMFVVMF